MARRSATLLLSAWASVTWSYGLVATDAPPNVLQASAMVKETVATIRPDMTVAALELAISQLQSNGSRYNQSTIDELRRRMSDRRSRTQSRLIAAGAFAPHPDELNQQALQVAGVHKQHESCIDVTIFMRTGKFGKEVSWIISSTPLRKMGSNYYISSEAYTSKQNKVYVQQECLPAAPAYTITMKDSYGDGWNGGHVRIYAGTHTEHDLEELERKGADFADFTGTLEGGHEKRETFTLPLPRDYTPPGDALDVALQAKLEEWKLLGVSVAIYKEGAYSEPIARGYGRTHADLSQADPVTGDTVQMIASMSKTILGAAATKLIDAGDIKIDDDIKDVLPSDWTPGAYRNPKSPDKPVTWRHIMTHMSSMTRDVQDMSRSYGPKDAMNGAKKGNHQCPITDLAGFYGDYMMDRGITTTVGQDDGAFDWYDALLLTPPICFPTQQPTPPLTPLVHPTQPTQVPRGKNR